MYKHASSVPILDIIVVNDTCGKFEGGIVTSPLDLSWPPLPSLSSPLQLSFFLNFTLNTDLRMTDQWTRTSNDTDMANTVIPCSLLSMEKIASSTERPMYIQEDRGSRVLIAFVEIPLL